MTEFPIDLKPLGGPHYNGEFWPLTPDEVSSLENTIGWKLDPYYINFLLEYGVSRPVLPRRILHEFKDDDAVAIATFYGAPDGVSKSILSGASEFLDGTPLFVFADSDNGLFFMNEENQVLFERAGVNELHLLADSFSDFLQALVIDENYV